MSNVVLGYPKINQTDFDWIQAIRKTDDRQYEIVKPHVTFIFPTTKLAEDELATHVRRKVASIKRFNITLSKAVVIEDDSKNSFIRF
jgi:2'-5' RNA ligase